MLKNIRNYLLQNKYKFIVGAIFLIISDIFLLIVPMLIGNIIDLMLMRNLLEEYFYAFLLYMAIASIVIFVSRFISRKLITGASTSVEIGVRMDYFKQLQYMPNHFYIKFKKGDLINRMTNDINDMVDFIERGYSKTVSSSFIIISTCYLMFGKIDFKLSLIALSPLPFILISSAFFGNIIREKYMGVTRNLSELSEFTRESLDSIRAIKGYTIEDSVEAKFKRYNKVLYSKNLEFAIVWGFLEPLNRFLSMVALLLALYFGSNAIIKSNLTIGQFVVFISYLNILLVPFMECGNIINIYHKGIASINRINEILEYQADSVEEVLLKSKTKEIKSCSLTNYSIEFKDLSFTYRDALVPTIKHINFKIEEGMTIGIIGRSGSGKTTLIQLLTRILQPIDNSIFIGGVDINYMPQEDLYKKIAYMSQESFIFSKSIFFNITMGDKSIELDTIIEYAKIINIHKDIVKLKYSYDTIIKNSKRGLSLVQKQKIALLRVLVSKAPIVIFDDSVSVSHNDNQIINNIRNLTKDKTVILSSHRISTVEKADKIIVLDKGFIVAKGKHENLINENEYYQKLYAAQRIENKFMDEEF